jgi:2-polyprenyl-3-methyl-5-hydroxy-6-metoxy-1,4-benzoquinol methylase
MCHICPLCHCKESEELATLKTGTIISAHRGLLRQILGRDFATFSELRYLSCRNCDLKFFDPALTGSPEYYEQLALRYESYYLEDKSEYDFAKTFINEDDKVLEIGAGKGVFAKKISAKRYIGLELSLKAIEMALRQGVELIDELIEEHSLKNEETYDVICAFQVLEHISDIYGFISSCIRCLKHKGIIIYSVPSADSYVSLVPNATLNLPPHHISHWPDSTLRNVTKIFPLELVKIEHEILADIHKRNYSVTVCEQAINSLIGRKHTLLDISLKGKIVRSFASLFSRFFVRGLADSRIRPQGHSVTVVYRKY